MEVQRGAGAHKKLDRHLAGDFRTWRTTCELEDNVLAGSVEKQFSLVLYVAGPADAPPICQNLPWTPLSGPPKSRQW
jgi:hypothetical protein